MKLSQLALCLVCGSVLPMLPAIAAPSISAQIDAFRAQAAALESSNSSGQIDACIPAKEHSLAAISGRLEAETASLAAAEARYLALKPSLDTLNGALDNTDFICNAPAEIKDQVRQIQAAAQEASDALEAECKAVHESDVAFSNEFVGRARWFLTDLRAGVPATCKRTAGSVNRLQKLLKQASDTCYSLESDSVANAKVMSRGVRDLGDNCAAAMQREQERQEERAEANYERHERVRNYDRHHPIGALFCQGECEE